MSLRDNEPLSDDERREYIESLLGTDAPPPNMPNFGALTPDRRRAIIEAGLRTGQAIRALMDVGYSMDQAAALIIVAIAREVGV